jgi:hypothetical protein
MRNAGAVIGSEDNRTAACELRGLAVHATNDDLYPPHWNQIGPQPGQLIISEVYSGNLKEDPDLGRPKSADPSSAVHGS